MLLDGTLAAVWNVTSASSLAKQDGGSRGQSWWMCWVIGLRGGVTETVNPSTGPEQPAAGTAHRGHWDYSQFSLLRWNQPPALGKENKNKPTNEGTKLMLATCKAYIEIGVSLNLSRNNCLVFEVGVDDLCSLTIAAAAVIVLLSN